MQKDLFDHHYDHTSSSVATKDPGGEDTQEEKISSVTLEALYNINKHARQYAERAKHHYELESHYNAKTNSNKKKALYKLKTKVIRRIMDNADKIERHKIHGNKYYCFYFGDWSFHVPYGKIEVSQRRLSGGLRTLSNFKKTGEKEKSSLPLKSCLLHFKKTYDLNANNYLPQKRVGKYFIGWSYL